MKTDTYPPVLTELVLAFTLLSRIPTPHLPDHAFENSARAVWAYPLVGLVAGAVATGTAYILLSLGLPALLAGGLGLALLTMITGALHEDGLADVADGFWGGHDPERRLQIMKDSQIGSYGTLALVFVTGLRWLAWATLLAVAPAALVAAAVLSRATMPLLMVALPHARASGLSHAVGRPDARRAMTGTAIALILSALLIGVYAMGAAIAVGVAAIGTAVLARRRIAGQTGDVLGACQQLAELSALCLLATLIA
ncbi:adenosylcobinamide-GDP ribazoletransferase [uncultured Roseobacter sp.]|uniref:adenosylcobinamide-GDP ribazoletransferase n=1 Tax=uncultured Roseobacter sp. TaxID=114847 RepID=UPI002613A117|nr:adenosylcobinamide-GDP ribazoletransferase [uncultured Roseobacter sp.]